MLFISWHVFKQYRRRSFAQGPLETVDAALITYTYVILFAFNQYPTAFIETILIKYVFVYGITYDYSYYKIPVNTLKTISLKFKVTIVYALP